MAVKYGLYGAGWPIRPVPRPPAPRPSRSGSTTSVNYDDRIQAGLNVRTRTPTFDMTPIADTRRGIGAEYDAAIAEIMAKYAGSVGGGGGGGAAIAAAKELLAEVSGNRKALGKVYSEYEKTVDQPSQEAIDAAISIVAQAVPQLRAIGASGKAQTQATYDESDASIAAIGALIGAGSGATQSVANEQDEEALFLADAAGDTATDIALAGLTSKAAQAAAVAAESGDLGDIRRRSHLLDMQFEDMEEQAKERLAAARAAAAAAAASRRRAASSRNAEIAALKSEKAQAMRLNPHESGEAVALSYLQTNGANLDYNRQQLVLSTVGNAISQQVAVGQVPRWLASQGLPPLRPAELTLTQGALRAYTAGMRYQQGQDAIPLGYGTEAGFPR